MNYRLKLALGCILAVTALPSYGADLLEVYQKAQQADPSIREADATRLANREARPQAWAALLPLIEGSASYRDANSEGITESFGVVGGTVDDPILGPVPEASSTDRTTKGYSINARQTIFSWSQWADLRRSNSEVALAEATYRAAQQDLVVRVAQRYLNVLAAQDTLDANTAAAEAFSRQLEQSEKRFEVGLIAITDVQEARAERDRTTADVISAKRNLATTKELLREITGELFETLSPPSDDMPLVSPTPSSEDAWVAAASEGNLSLIASRLNAEIASERVSAARGGHLPNLTLSASRGNTRGETQQTRNGIARAPVDTDTDDTAIALSLNVPIFASGATQSRVRQSVYLHRAARERVERVTRETERAARDSFLGVTTNISRVQALKQAYESSLTALQATEAGYEVGTRTTVDVLQSRRTVYSAQTQYLRSKYDYILSVIQLKQAAGTLSEQDIVEINGWLK